MDKQESATVWKRKLICGVYDRMCGYVFVGILNIWQVHRTSLGIYIYSLSHIFLYFLWCKLVEWKENIVLLVAIKYRWLTHNRWVSYVWKVMKYSPMTYLPSREPQNDNKNGLRNKIFIVNQFWTLRTIWLIPLKISWALVRSEMSTNSSSGACGCLSICKGHVSVCQ